MLEELGVFLSPLGGTVGLGSLGEEWCCQSTAAPLTFLMWSTLVSVVQRGALSSPLCPRVFTMVSCQWIVTVRSSCEGDWSWEWPVSPSWWCHSFTNYFFISTPADLSKTLDDWAFRFKFFTFLFAEGTVEGNTVVLRQPFIQIKPWF